jgi:beta-glucosidase
VWGLSVVFLVVPLVLSEHFQYPFQNYHLSFEERVDDFVSRLTLAEKVGQTGSRANAIPRFGLKPYNWRNNCVHGWSTSNVAWPKNTTWQVFPSNINWAASFDARSVFLMGGATADQGRALHNQALRLHNGSSPAGMGLNCWSPDVNLYRDPRWGRGQETLGEDPFLISRLSVEFTKGLQYGDDPRYIKIAACAKHFAAHSAPDGTRMSFSANVTTHDLFDTYLPAFKAQVQEAKVEMFMPAYSAINGIPDTANAYLLRDILRKKFGFKGATTSDNGGVIGVFTGHHYVKSKEAAAVACMVGGCDLDLGPDTIYQDYLEAAVKSGQVPEHFVTEAVKHLMMIRFKVGDFDPDWLVPYKGIPMAVLTSRQQEELNLQAARASLVLLRNENFFLPLNETKLQKIAVIGPNANATQTLLGYYYGIPPKIVSVLDSLQTRFFPRKKITYAAGCANITCQSSSLIKEAVEVAKGADVVILVAGLSQVIEHEAFDRTYGYACDLRPGWQSPVLGLPGCQSDLVQAVHAANPNVALVILSGSPVSTPWELNNIPAILEAWYPGSLGGQAITDALFGDYNPGGKLPVTIYPSVDDIPALANYDMTAPPGRTYRYYTGPVLLPFGFGLSYTTFQFSRLYLSSSIISPCKSINVSVVLRNTGTVYGDEVVQLYVRAPSQTAYPVPIHSLQGFDRIGLLANEQTTVRFVLKPAGMAVVNNEGEHFINTGKYQVFVGGQQPLRSGNSAVLSAFFQVQGTNTNIDKC